MIQLQVVKFDGAKVLPTAQLAYQLGSSGDVILRNFQRNRGRYEEGVHYCALSGDLLKKYKVDRGLTEILKFVSNYYLWTEKGACLHAKSLRSEEAWEAYQILFDAYFNGSPSEFEGYILPSAVQKNSCNIGLHLGEQKRLRSAVGERVQQLAGKENGARPVLFRAIYRAIRERYEVESYRDVKQHQLQGAIKFVEDWGREH